jgi:Family of unknown function (DUF6011)
MSDILQKLNDIRGAIFHILGGYAWLTISHHDPEKYLTYKIIRSKKEPATYYVKVKTNSGYKYMGVLKYLMYQPFHCSYFFRTQKSEVAYSDLEFRAFRWIWINLFGCGIIPDNVELFRNNRCCVCGAVLTTPKSIEAGVGPVCAKKHPLREGGMESV